MIAFEIDGQGQSGVLRLKGAFPIERAAELHTALVDSLQRADSVSVAGHEALEFSLPCLQLLCSAHRSAVVMKKQFFLADEPSPAFQEAMKRGGFLRHSGCFADCKNNCLWIGA